RAADAPDQTALLVGHGDDARAVRPLDDRRHLAAATVDADLASDHEEAAGLVVPDDRLSAILDDDAVGLASDEAVAFTHFAAFVAQGIDTVDRLSLRTGRLRHDRAARRDGGLRRRLRDGRRGRGRRCRRSALRRLRLTGLCGLARCSLAWRGRCRRCRLTLRGGRLSRGCACGGRLGGLTGCRGRLSRLTGLSLRGWRLRLAGLARAALRGGILPPSLI